MKSIISFIVLAAVVLAAVGCGDNSSPTSTAPPQGSKNPLGGDAGGGGKAVAPDK
jgi:hypothetical protein